MKKLLFFGFSLLCLFNLSAMDKMTKEHFDPMKTIAKDDYKELKRNHEKIDPDPFSPQNLMSVLEKYVELQMNYRKSITIILNKYNIKVPESDTAWLNMFNEMGKHISKKGCFSKFMDRCLML